MSHPFSAQIWLIDDVGEAVRVDVGLPVLHPKGGKLPGGFSGLVLLILSIEAGSEPQDETGDAQEGQQPAGPQLHGVVNQLG